MKEKDDKKTSIIKEALTDYDAIKDAAEASAKKRLADEYPEKFNNLIKEEINKNKAKESYKKVDDAKESDKDDIKTNKESVMKKDEKETKKVDETAGDGKPFEENPKKVETVEEDVKITDTVGDGDPYDKKVKGKKNVSEEREKDFMADVETETPNTAKNGGEKGDRFTEKIKEPSSGKPMSNLKEEFDITDLNVSQVGSALEGAGEEDEITIDDIEEEIAAMDNFDAEPETQTGDDAYNQLYELKNQLDEILQNMGGVQEQKNKGGMQNVSGRENGGPTTSMIDEDNMEEMHSAGDERFGTSNQVAQLHQGNPLIDEEEITDADIDAALSEQEVDETIAMPHPNKRVTTATLPGKEYQSDGNVQRMRYAMRETEKKIGSLIDENKKLTKKLNEAKNYKKSVSTLVEEYKGALEKYRNQLREMATFNTNLAHVNNLLVNESLALTHDDKIKIINEFKKVDSIAKSQEKYNEILNEMKSSRKTLTESIETKVSASIQPSSKQKLDEVVEKTAYENDEHINKMKKLIEYVENRGKKIIK